MGTIFMDSENSKTSDPHRLLLKLIEKINLKWSDKYVALSNHLLYMEKYKKSRIRTINLKLQLQHGMKNLNYLMDH